MIQNSFHDLKDKVCIITGGTGVIGSQLAKGFASVGTKTAILGRNVEKGQEIAQGIEQEFGTPAKGYKANVLSKEDLESVKQAVHQDLGKVDILINCAGGNSPKATTELEQLTEKDMEELQGSFFDLSMDGFDDTYALNFKGSLLPAMIFGRDMAEKRQGNILNISSMAALTTITKVAAYSAAKAAITNFTHWLAVHLGKTGIRVNALAPGFFLTNQNRFLLTNEDGSLKERGHKIVNSTPFGRFGDVEELVGPTLFLVSDMAGFVTGTVLPVDGGFKIYSGV